MLSKRLFGNTKEEVLYERIIDNHELFIVPRDFKYIFINFFFFYSKVITFSENLAKD